MNDFVSFAAERGLIIDDGLVSGKWKRVKTVDHPRSKNGAYYFAGEYGHVQNWAIQETPDTWFDNKPRTAFEQKELKIKMDVAKKSHSLERQALQRKASEKAKWILSQCELSQHAYLDSKGFRDLLANVWHREDCDPLLVIPMYFRGNICGVQLIDIHGNKKFLKGQRTNDATFNFNARGQNYLCEGYATALSLKAVLKPPYSIHVCFSAGNILRVAKTLPDAIVCADNDASGTGERVARVTGLKWFMPEKVGQDFNDFHQEMGLFKASQWLRKQL